MGLQSDQRLRDQIKAVLDETAQAMNDAQNGTDISEHRVNFELHTQKLLESIDAYIDESHAETMNPYLLQGAEHDLETNFTNLFRGMSGTPGSYFDHFRETMAKLGILDGHVALNGEAQRKEEDSRFWKTFRAQLQTILAQEATTEAIRELQETLADVARNLDNIDFQYTTRMKVSLNTQIGLWGKVETEMQDVERELDDAIKHVQEAQRKGQFVDPALIDKKIESAVESTQEARTATAELSKEYREIIDFLADLKQKSEDQLDRMAAGAAKLGDPETERLSKLLIEDLRNGEVLDVQTNSNYRDWVNHVEKLKETNPNLYNTLNALEQSFDDFKKVNSRLRREIKNTELNADELKTVDERIFGLEEQLKAIDPRCMDAQSLLEELQKAQEERRVIYEQSQEKKEAAAEAREDMDRIGRDMKSRFKYSASSYSQEAPPETRPGYWTQWKNWVKNETADWARWGSKLYDRAVGNEILRDKDGNPVYRTDTTKRFYTFDDDGNRKYLSDEDQVVTERKYKKIMAEQKAQEEAALDKPAPEVAQITSSEDSKPKAAEVEKTAQLAPAALEQHPLDPVPYEVARGMFPPKDINLATKFEPARGETVDPTNEPAALHKIAPPSLVG